MFVRVRSPFAVPVVARAVARAVVAVVAACGFVAGVAVDAGCATVTRRAVRATAPEPTFVVDVAAVPPTSTSVAPTLRAEALRGRIDDERRALVDGVDAIPAGWVPVEDAGTRGHIVVAGRVGGRDLRVVVDSAAAQTIVAPALAAELQLKPAGALVTVHDATGAEVAAREAVLPPLDVGGARFVGLRVLVPDHALRPDLFLLGVDALGHVDTWLDVHAGAVAFVPPSGPLPAGHELADAVVVALSRDDDGRFVVAGAAPGAHGLAAFDLVVDTASPLTSVPAAIGVRTGVPADVARRATLRGAAGAGVERRGRFQLAPLSLGMVQVGPVSALETPADRGVLGVDVLQRARVVLSPARSALLFFPVDVATGPRVAGAVPAVDVRVEDEDGHDSIVVDARPALLQANPGGVRLFLRPYDGATGTPLGGVLEVTLTSPGRRSLDVDLPLMAAGVEYAVVPRATRDDDHDADADDADECDDDVCLRLFGDWGVPVR
jgi:predicted aspartyl protease